MAINIPPLNPNIGSPGLGGQSPEQRSELVVSTVIGLLTIAAGLWFVIQFIMGAIHWIGAGGDKGALQTARSQITQAITGLAIVAASFIMLTAISYIFGINIIDFAGALSVLRITR